MSLPGTVTGYSFGIARIEAGTPAELSDGSASTFVQYFDATPTYPKPPSISLTFDAMNGAQETVFSEITSFGDGIGGVVDLADPPMLSLTVPFGARVATAGGVDKFHYTAVPEPSRWAMRALGFVAVGFLG